MTDQWWQLQTDTEKASPSFCVEKKGTTVTWKTNQKDSKWNQLACARCTMDELRKLREKRVAKVFSQVERKKKKDEKRASMDESLSRILIKVHESSIWPSCFTVSSEWANGRTECQSAILSVAVAVVAKRKKTSIESATMRRRQRHNLRILNVT